ncbi:histidinol-phosphate transaminase [Pontibacter silvestris]|uniref:Histidinol-phosphate aminotransferase n=1 Tax=Pontibacter silvestris TaxID=2305183 RepID=A0ABW4X0A2_9BACT|nr:histidinol-phosphate transaminase [Pontibacter silvestris]MCC9135507.1 histidinol-phosphate transaminase [Pontibacter silvestris]
MIYKNTAVYNAGTNENLFGASAKVTAAVTEALVTLNSYPEPDATPLREALAQKLSVRSTQIIVGSGSGELISLLVQAYCYPFHESAILSVRPTFPLYQMEARDFGVRYEAISLDSSYNIQVDDLLYAVNDSTRLCFISNPNNPTGSCLSVADLKRLIQELPAHVTLVLDEAYIEYASSPDFGSALPFLQERDNLVVLRTFSKVYGLASLRVGYMVAQEATIDKVKQLKQPFNVNHLAQIAAATALQDEDFLQYTLQETATGKAHLQSVLDKLGIQYWPSEGNFLYVDAGLPARPLCQQLQQQGVLVRLGEDSFSLRITIGTKKHQDYLHHILKTMLTPSHLLEEQPLAQILETGQALADSQKADFRSATETLASFANKAGTPAERIALAYTRAFQACQQDGSLYSGNLYSSDFGELDMISAFGVLVKSTPLVTFGHMFANLTIVNAVANAQEVHILDLGIGSGVQWFHLLDQLAARPGGAPKIRFTGIDIAAATGAPEHRLQETGNRLMQHAASLNINATYSCIATKLEEFDLRTLTFTPSETLVINSALTLHHIFDQLVKSPDQRDGVLKQIKALSPTVFTLTEPDSEHNKLEFMPRLRESLRHYYTVFDVLGTLLPADMPERQVIEQEFFGREIINVTSCEGAARVERHERNEAWQRRLTRLGFIPYEEQDMAEDLIYALRLHENFTLVPNGAGYTLHWKGTPVISSTAWV